MRKTKAKALRKKAALIADGLPPITIRQEIEGGYIEKKEPISVKRVYRLLKQAHKQKWRNIL